MLLGSSGVGKTTLRNALAGGPSAATAPVRERDDRGRHTTTARELVPLASGAILIDTPGLRLPRLWEQAGGLAAAYADVETLARSCRFADCRHARRARLRRRGRCRGAGRRRALERERAARAERAREASRREQACELASVSGSHGDRDCVRRERRDRRPRPILRDLRPSRSTARRRRQSGAGLGDA